MAANGWESNEPEVLLNHRPADRPGRQFNQQDELYIAASAGPWRMRLTLARRTDRTDSPWFFDARSCVAFDGASIHGANWTPSFACKLDLSPSDTLCTTKPEFSPLFIPPGRSQCALVAWYVGWHWRMFKPIRLVLSIAYDSSSGFSFGVWTNRETDRCVPVAVRFVANCYIRLIHFTC